MLSEDEAIQIKYKAILKNLTIKSRKCFDCSAKNPIWGDIHFGIFVCFHCAGKHRSMGTHISFVRSTTFDGWSADNMKRMVAGGNKKAAEYFSNYGMRVSKCRSFADFYDGKIARRYKEILDREAQKVVLEITTPIVTPISSFHTCGLDNIIGDISTSKQPIKKKPSKKKLVKAQKTTTSKSEEPNEMALLFNNMVVSSSKQKKRSPTSKKRSPQSKTIKTKKHIKVVDIAQDDSSSEDDFEAEMEKAKSRKQPISPVISNNENSEFGMGFGPSKIGFGKKETFKKKDVGSSQSKVKEVFENKYGKKMGDKSMTSISSSDFIKGEITPVMKRAQYQNATSIGSDAFFGREVSPERDDEIDWDDVRNEAVHKAQQLTEAASSWFSSVKDSLR